MSNKKKFTKRRFDEVLQIKERREQEIFQRKGVVAAGVGRKNLNGELGIIIYVEKKLPLSALSDEELIPREVDGVITDIVETGPIVAGEIADHRLRYRPVHAGISAIRVGQTSCTLGAIVYKEGKAYALQNAHCVYPHWNGAEIGDAVLQPSPNDGGTIEEDIMGYTYDGQEIVFGGVVENTIDAAIVELATNFEFYELEGLGTLDPTPATVSVDDTVHKSGRTTGVTTSTVSSTNGTSNTDYSGDGGGTAKFVNQLIIHNPNAEFSAGGDSSSLVVNESLQPVGLLYAGSSTPSPSGITVVNPISAVIDRFGISFEKPWEFAGKKLVNIPRSKVGRIMHEGKYIDALTSSFVWTDSTKTIEYPRGTRINYLYDSAGEIIYYDEDRVRVEIV